MSAIGTQFPMGEPWDRLSWGWVGPKGQQWTLDSGVNVICGQAWAVLQ